MKILNNLKCFILNEFRKILKQLKLLFIKIMKYIYYANIMKNSLMDERHKRIKLTISTKAGTGTRLILYFFWQESSPGPSKSIHGLA